MAFPDAPEKTPNETCENCFFRIGEQCRRYPPVLGQSGAGLWPVIHHLHWCGEWQSIPTSKGTEP